MLSYKGDAPQCQNSIRKNTVETIQITAVDPVCGMNVSPSSSLQSTFDGKPYFFCCASCQTKFESDPASVLAKRVERDSLKKKRTTC